MEERSRIVEVDSDLYHGLKRLSHSKEFKHICSKFDTEAATLQARMMNPNTSDVETVTLKKILNSFDIVHPAQLLEREIRNMENKAIKRERRGGV
jgi:hypothetical protein